MLTPEEFDRYSQQIKLSEIGLEGQLKLKNARVLCIGAGGLASTLLMYLATAGVGEIGIIDEDIIELSNLQRQVLFRTPDISSSKAFTASQQLKLLNPNININVYDEKLNVNNVEKYFNLYDIIADCADNSRTTFLINDFCYYLKKPFVYASIGKYQGQCSFFTGQDNACFRCLFSPESFNTATNCELGGVLGVVPGLLGMIQANEIIKYILNIGGLLMNSLLVVDLLKNEFKQFSFEKNPTCIRCQTENIPDNIYNHVDVNAISATEMKTFLNLPDTYLIDVRTREEHEHFNIGGISIPLAELPNQMMAFEKNKTFIVYCQSGIRSIKAIELLLKNQFQSVKYLKNGLSGC